MIYILLVSYLSGRRRSYTPGFQVRNPPFFGGGIPLLELLLVFQLHWSRWPSLDSCSTWNPNCPKSLLEECLHSQSLQSSSGALVFSWPIYLLWVGWPLSMVKGLACLRFSLFLRSEAGSTLIRQVLYPFLFPLGPQIWKLRAAASICTIHSLYWHTNQ